MFVQAIGRTTTLMSELEAGDFLVDVAGRRLTFEVSVTDSGGTVARGKVVRMVVVGDNDFVVIFSGCCDRNRQSYRTGRTSV